MAWTSQEFLGGRWFAGVGFVGALRGLAAIVIVLVVALAGRPAPASPSAPADRTTDQNATADYDLSPALLRAFAAKGFQPGSAAFVRIFKASSQLEIWLQQGERFALFDSYEICKWSGALGPKLYEGDKQSPEGVYYVSGGNLRTSERWHLGIDLGFPNSVDQSLGRTGSGILIHGKCSSIGCFAMTDPRIEDIFAILRASLLAGQSRVPVHVFPFAMTDENLKKRKSTDWAEFWGDLAIGYALFERDRLPPIAHACTGRYGFTPHGDGPTGLPQDRGGCVALETAKTAVRVAGLNPPVPQLSPTEAALQRAKTCSAKDPKCRMLRIALQDDVACPKKFARCRNARQAAMKSVDCPLKFPRCRKGR